MNGVIFFKQSLRSFKKNWSIVTLLFLFLIVGISMLVGIVSYILNIHTLVINNAFKSGSLDGKMAFSRLAYDETQISDVRDILFLDDIKNQLINFNVSVSQGLTLYDYNAISNTFITGINQDSFYRYLFENNGFVQSFIFKSNNFGINNNPELLADYTTYMNRLQGYNGNLFAAFFNEELFKNNNFDHSNWSIQSSVSYGYENIGFDSGATISAPQFNDAKVTNVIFSDSVYQSDSDDPDPDLPIKNNGLGEQFANLDTKIQWNPKSEADKVVYVSEKTMKNFNLHYGQEIDFFNEIYSPGNRNMKLKVVGTFLNTSEMISFPEAMLISTPYSEYWKNIGATQNYLSIDFFVVTNESNLANYKSKVDVINNALKPFFVQSKKDADGNEILLSTDFINEQAKSWLNYIQFWEINYMICLLVIILVLVLVFFVIIFTTKQLINNNRKTLQFLKSLGMNNFELSSINVALVLIPVILSFLFSIPIAFLMENIFGFMLHFQYPMTIVFWHFTPWTILSYGLIFIFTILIFFISNLMVLKQKNILNNSIFKIKFKTKKHERKTKKIKINQNLKIGLSLAKVNLKKNLVTFLIMTSTFSVIMFGIDFKSSIQSQATGLKTFFSPYRNYSSISENILTSNQENEKQEQLFLSQKNDVETDENSEISYKFLSSLYQDLTDPTAIDNLIKVFQSDVQYKFLRSSTVQKVHDDLEQMEIYKIVENYLKEHEDQYPNWKKYFEQTKKSINSIYVNFEKLKTILNVLYNYHDDFIISFGANYKIDSLQKIINEPIINQSNEEIHQEIDFSKEIYSKTLSSSQQIDKKLSFHDNPFVLTTGIKENSPIDNQIFNWKNQQQSNNVLLIDISQNLAAQWKIDNNTLKREKISFNIKFSFNDSTNDKIDIPVKVRRIINKDFAQPNIYYSIDQLIEVLKTKIIRAPSLLLRKQIQFLIDLSDNQKTNEMLNGTYSSYKIPFNLLNVTLPIVHNQGLKIWDYTGDGELSTSSFQVLDFDLISNELIFKTKNYQDIMQRIMYIFSGITVIVSLLLAYLFLVENKNIIALFKALGYSKTRISLFILNGYIIASIIASLAAIGFTAAAMAIISQAFLEMLNVVVPFVFSKLLVLMIISLPIIFSLIIGTSSYIYIYLQDPKKVLQNE